MAIAQYIKNVVPCIFVMLFFAAQANAMYLDKGKTFYFGGKFSTRNSVRITDSRGNTRVETESGHLAQSRNLLYLEAEHDLKSVFRPLGFDIKYHLLGRFLYEGVYDYGPSEYRDLKDAYHHEIDEFSQDPQLWEAYVDISRGPLFLRIGKQNLVWGETDVFRLMDLINPLDNTYGGIFEDLDDRRVPLNMIRGNYNFGEVGPVSSFGVECFFSPGAYENDVAPQSPYGTPYSAPVPPFSEGSIPGLWEFDEAFNHPDTDSRSSRYGIRLMGVLGENVNFTLAHFKSFFDEVTPVFRLKRQIALGPEGPIPGRLTLSKEFPDVRVTAASLNYYDWKTDMVYRAELAYFYDEPVFIPEKNTPHPSINPFGLPEFRSGEIPTKDFLKFCIGLDKDQWIRWLNSHDVFTVSFQYFGSYCLDYDHHMRYAIPDTHVPNLFNIRRKCYEQTFTLKVMTEYLNGNLTPDFVASYDPRGAWFFMPSVSYRFEPFILKLEVDTINGNFVGFGFFNDRDQVSLTATYYW